MQEQAQVKHFLAALIAPVTWGFIAWPIKNLQGFTAEQILNYRIFVALILTWLAILLFRRARLQEAIKHFRTEKQWYKILGLLFLSGLCLIGNWYSFIYVINLVSVQSGAFAYLILPLFTALGGFFLLKESLSGVQRFALLLSFVSAAILGWGHLRDVLGSCIVALAFTAYLLLQRSIVGYDKLVVLGLQLIGPCLFLVPLEFYLHESVPTSTLFWLNTLSLAAIFTVAPLFLILFASTRIPASSIGIFMYGSPVTAFLLAWARFGETFTPQKQLAYGIIGVALILFNWALIKRALSSDEVKVIK